MRIKFKGLLFGAWLAALGLSAGTANAASTVRFTGTYIGNYFDRFYAGSGSNAYTTANRITGSFVAEVEDTNQFYYGHDIVKSYSFSDGFQTLTHLNSTASFSLSYFSEYGPGITDFEAYSSFGRIYFHISDNGSWEGGASQFGEGETYNVDYNWTFTTSDVPEPAAWAMLIAGFGLTGAAMRRRRNTQNHASPIAAR